MFLPRQSTQANPEPKLEFKPSDRYHQIRSNADSFFLFGCFSAGILAVNLARISPNYRSLLILLVVGVIATLAFFPHAESKQVRRTGIIAVAMGLAVANWDAIASIKFALSPIHIAIGIGIVVAVLVVLAAIGAGGKS